ncbi:hypothetical protein [Sphingomonas sp.]|uniref:hypothetical protein n=1 Tax=Sphingomonas sp. TaxID=28214 RepID=UPI002600E795|nr:hypothetical protein [Sphingomonas sp.]
MSPSFTALLIALQASSTTAPFEFRGLTVATTEAEAVQRGIVNSCKKHLIPGVRECALTDRSLAGRSTLFGVVQFRQGRMVHIGALVSSQYFGLVRGALDERYGKPCLVNPSTERRRGPGDSIYWCFDDGAVRLQQYATGGMTSFSYYARSYDDLIGDLRPSIDF